MADIILTGHTHWVYLYPVVDSSRSQQQTCHGGQVPCTTANVEEGHSFLQPVGNTHSRIVTVMNDCRLWRMETKSNNTGVLNLRTQSSH